MSDKAYFIFVSGLYGSGKSLIASKLRNLFEENGFQHKTQTQPFAFFVKEIAEQQFGWDKKKDDKGRKLLQNVGFIGREYNKDIWVEKAYLECCESYDYGVRVFLFDDWRYENEFEFILNREVEFNENNVEKNHITESKIFKIRVIRDIERDENVLSHESERSLPTDETYYDFIINNNYTSMEEMEQALNENVFQKIINS